MIWRESRSEAGGPVGTPSGRCCNPPEGFPKAALRLPRWTARESVVDISCTKTTTCSSTYRS